MKKIDFDKNNDLFVLGKIIKEKLPDKKIYLKKINNKLIIKIPKNTNYLSLEELKALIKTNYSDYEVKFQYFD